jgi:hypothetical protein
MKETHGYIHNFLYFGRFYLKMDTESSLENTVFTQKKKKQDNGFYFLVLHPVARNTTILNEGTTFCNQIMRVIFIILYW